MTSGFYFYFRSRTSGWVVGGERIKEAGNKYGSATMSRPDQWSCLFWEKNPEEIGLFHKRDPTISIERAAGRCINTADFSVFWRVPHKVEIPPEKTLPAICHTVSFTFTVYLSLFLLSPCWH